MAGEGCSKSFFISFCEEVRDSVPRFTIRDFHNLKRTVNLKTDCISRNGKTQMLEMAQSRRKLLTQLRVLDPYDYCLDPYDYWVDTQGMLTLPNFFAFGAKAIA